jgi:hypothetical protein
MKCACIAVPLAKQRFKGLLQTGRQFVQPPPEKAPEVTLTLGGRQFSGTLQQPAFLAVRLDAGALPLHGELTGVKALDRIVFMPLAAEHEVAQRFCAFEKRSPRVGVHLGLRRDCGSTLSPVGVPQTVAGDKLTRLVFEGAIRISRVRMSKRTMSTILREFVKLPSAANTQTVATCLGC